MSSQGPSTKCNIAASSNFTIFLLFYPQIHYSLYRLFFMLQLGERSDALVGNSAKPGFSSRHTTTVIVK